MSFIHNLSLIDIIYFIIYLFILFQVFFFSKWDFSINIIYKFILKSKFQKLDFEMNIKDCIFENKFITNDWILEIIEIRLVELHRNTKWKYGTIRKSIKTYKNIEKNSKK